MRDHYVPRYYLRNFSTNHRLFVFDKIKKALLSEKPISINEVAIERNIHEMDAGLIREMLNVDANDSRFFDDEIREFNESISARLLKSFWKLGEEYNAKKGFPGIVSLVRFRDVIDFIIVQAFRTPGFRDSISPIIKSQFAARHAAFDKSPPRSQWVKNAINLLLYLSLTQTRCWKAKHRDWVPPKHFKDVVDYLNLLIEKINSASRLLFVSKSDALFCTSDNPIIFRFSSEEEFFKFIYVPFSSRTALYLSNPKLCPELAERNRSVDVVDNSKKQIIENFNLMMIKEAKRFIYSQRFDIENSKKFAHGEIPYRIEF